MESMEMHRLASDAVEAISAALQRIGDLQQNWQAEQHAVDTDHNCDDSIYGTSAMIAHQERTTDLRRHYEGRLREILRALADALLKVRYALEGRPTTVAEPRPIPTGVQPFALALNSLHEAMETCNAAGASYTSAMQSLDNDPELDEGRYGSGVMVYYDTFSKGVLSRYTGSILDAIDRVIADVGSLL